MLLVLECRRARPDTLSGEMWRMGGWPDLLEEDERCVARYRDLDSSLGSPMADTWSTLLARAAILDTWTRAVSHVKLCK